MEKRCAVDFGAKLADGVVHLRGMGLDLKTWAIEMARENDCSIGHLQWRAKGGDERRAAAEKIAFARLEIPPLPLCQRGKPRCSKRAHDLLRSVKDSGRSIEKADEGF